MKKKYITAAWALLIICLLSFQACDKDETPTAQQLVTEKLLAAAAWQAPVVTVDGVDRSDVYKDLSITFRESTFSTVAGAPIWPAEGPWHFIDDEATRIQISDKFEAELNSVDDEFLELSLTWESDTFESGRKTSVKGKHKIKLKKK